MSRGDASVPASLQSLLPNVLDVVQPVHEPTREREGGPQDFVVVLPHTCQDLQAAIDQQRVSAVGNAAGPAHAAHPRRPQGLVCGAAG